MPSAMSPLHTRHFNTYLFLIMFVGKLRYRKEALTDSVCVCVKDIYRLKEGYNASLAS